MSVPLAEEVVPAARAVPSNGATKDNGEQHQNATFVSQVAALPVVAEACTFASSTIYSIADKYTLARTVVNATSAAAARATKASERYQERFAPQICKVDDAANKVLDVVKQKFPIITQQPAEVVASAKNAAGHLKSSVTASKPVMFASFSRKKFEAAFAAAVDKVEVAVDKFLPESEGKTKVNGVENANGSSHATGSYVKRIVYLPVDIKRRVAHRKDQKMEALRGQIADAKDEVVKIKDWRYVAAAVEPLRSHGAKLALLFTTMRENVSFLRASGTQLVRAVDERHGISRFLEAVWRKPVVWANGVTQRFASLWHRQVDWTKSIAKRLHTHISELRIPFQFRRSGGDAMTPEVLGPKKDEDIDTAASNAAAVAAA